MKSTKRSSRRRFLAVAGVAAAASALAPADLLAQAAKAATQKQTQAPAAKAPAKTTATSPAEAKPDSARPTAEPTPPDIAAEAKHFLAIVQARYGKHLDAKQVEAVNTELEQRVTSGRRLRAVKLKNHEEPDFTFRA